MALREITDRYGRVWRVWEVRPGQLRAEIDANRVWSILDRRVSVRDRYLQGWLAFESGRDRRRLVPIPAAWETMSDPSLLALCEEADPVKHAGRGV